jgi:ABC-2 type transport system ATP-binding protein
MPDFFGVYEDLVVWEYLDFFARCYNLPPNRRTKVINELLELVDLTEKRDAFVHTLSRGMRQRLCLAHAMVHDPQVLLLDEPASGLDPRARVEMRELLRELGAMGKTVVLSSHILSELAELCDSIGIIERGRLVVAGRLEDIRHQIEGGRKLRIRILSDLEQAQILLSAQPGVSNVHHANGNGNGSSNNGEDMDLSNELEVELSGDDNAIADLLETLVANKIRVTAFNELHTGLEEVFLRLTKGEVA